MKKTSVLIALVLFLFVGLNSCVGLNGTCFNQRTVRGSGKLASEKRPVENINSVKLATVGTLHIEIGETESLEIEADENLLEYIETDVYRGELTIDTRNVSMRTRRSINYYLVVKELESIKTSSSGNIEAPDLKGDRVTLAVSSSGNIDLGDVEAQRVKIRISSSGDITMGEVNAKSIEVGISSSGNVRIAGGEVTDQDIHISSSGDYKARDLASREAEVRISSSGNALIQVSDYLGGSLSSSGDLRYVGDPDVDVRESSSGDCDRIGRGRRSRSI